MRAGNIVGVGLLCLVLGYFLTPGFATYLALHSEWVSYEWFDIYYMPGIVFAERHVPLYRQFYEWQIELTGMKNG